MTAPNGLAEIKALYGDPQPFIREDGTPSPLWEARMVVVPFPAPLPLGWNKSQLAKGARVNQAIASEVERVFTLLAQEGIWGRYRTFDGGYTWRTQRSSHLTLSMHSFGAALDFNAETNRQGTPGDMPPEVVQLWEACGWRWGGRFQGARIDPMHSQFATGY